MSSCNEMQNITLKIIFIKKKKYNRWKTKSVILWNQNQNIQIYIYKSNTSTFT